jgi:hypothetical protein
MFFIPLVGMIFWIIIHWVLMLEDEKSPGSLKLRGWMLITSIATLLTACLAVYLSKGHVPTLLWYLYVLGTFVTFVQVLRDEAVFITRLKPRL